MKDYETLIQAIEDLKKSGYTYDFNLMDNGIKCAEITTSFGPNDFNVEHVYRFEGMSNPSDSSILYVIQTLSGVKGLLVDSYGAYSGEVSEELLEKLNMKYQG
ncbi:MAG: phosphoribosylpyrophosphate synthetase [Saprospiraceae bacterium]|nr:phosphoribosylpyrophosphate synthetase [Saprospiraceae bacterium]